MAVLRRRLFAAALSAMSAAACAPYMPAREPPSPPAAAPDVERTTGFFAAADGTKLFHQSWRPLGQPRASLVIVHGLKDHSSRYSSAAEVLARRGYAVHALDLRGHARSEGVRVYVRAFDEYVSDVDAFVKRVRKAESALPMFLFGHSMGGAIVTTLVETRRPRLQGLVLSGAALKVNALPFKILGTMITDGIAPEAPVFQLDLAQFSRDAAVVKEGSTDPLVYQGAAPARTAAELIDAIDRMRGRFETLTVPLLVMHGGADKVTPPSGSRELYERARSEDKTLAIYEGLFHDLLHEPERAKVLGDMAAWMDARTPQSEP
jgi:acylglycerol lipase